jgi:hypothetical protein
LNFSISNSSIADLIYANPISISIAGDNLHNVNCEASRYFRNKNMEYMKNKINELATNSKNKNIIDLYSGIN